MHNPPCALVIGLCSHGLAVARSLHAEGIDVYAFEANPAIPGFLTQSAIVQLVPSIKNESLIDELKRFRSEIPADRQIVLFPTNDNNVRVIADNISRLRGDFLLSWENCAPLIKSLLLKSNIEARCVERNLLYPKSIVVDAPTNLATAVSTLSMPLIVKPVNPQSGFKALKFSNSDTLIFGMDPHARDFPVIVQEWIPGTAEDLYFCALYMVRGKPIEEFVGRKLESHPPALGQTTVAVTHCEPRLVELTKRFFTGLDISGPVSLELKKDQRGNYWVIEPTIGRSDFWLGLCIASGCDLPLIEYRHTIGEEPTCTGNMLKEVIWFDSERDATAPGRYCYKWIGFSERRFRPEFSYFNWKDRRPFYKAVSLAALRLKRSTLSRLTNNRDTEKPVDPSDDVKNYIVSCFDSFEELPKEYSQLLQQYGSNYIFFDAEWFQNFGRHVAQRVGSIKILCLGDTAGNAMAVLPLWQHEERFHGLKVRKLSSLTNYYSPRFELFVDQNLCTRTQAAVSLFSYIRNNFKKWDLIEFYPMLRESVEEIQAASHFAFPYYITENYVHPIESDFESYLNSRPSRHRNTIKRRLAKLRRLPDYSFDISLGDSRINDVMAHYHGVYLKSWKIDEPYPEFIDGLVRLASEQGWLRLGSLLIGGQVVASQIWLVANNTAYIYKLAYDRNFGEFSPGTLLTCEMLKHVIGIDHVNYVDFLHGNDVFKTDWMDSSCSLYGIQFPNTRSARGILLILMNYFSNWKEKWLKKRQWHEAVRSHKTVKMQRLLTPESGIQKDSRPT